ncbi:MAG: S-layer homology domain-containing protein, partial [Oscillospiraceae bacterium]|nr:S-layer homology domain-containing protein [Oscillospiraceae bacterium]
GETQHWHTCIGCGEVVESSMADHSYDVWTIVTAPTTTNEGRAERICARCDDVDVMILPVLPTDPSEGGGDGTEPAWQLTGSTEPTCTAAGSYVYTYGETGLTAAVVRPALGHNAPTAWTANGDVHQRACARCGVVVDSASHTYDGGVVTTQPTAYTTGVRTYTCTACEASYDETIPATGTTGPVFPAPDPGTGGGTGTGTGTGGSTMDIIDEDVPLADLPFVDVLPSDWFYEAVLYVYNRGLMNGVSDTEFDPYGTLNRAMVVTILYRLEGEPETALSSFKDVEEGKWYTKAIGWGAANGVVEGYDADRFGPMDPVTREQLAAILFRYASYKGYDVTGRADLTVYTDAAAIHEYAVEAMHWAVDLGAPTPVSETALAPRENATRAQVAEAFMNFCEKYVPLETEGEQA